MNVRLVVTTAHRLVVTCQDPIPALVELDIKIMDMGTVLVRLYSSETIIVFVILLYVCGTMEALFFYYLITVFFVLLL